MRRRIVGWLAAAVLLSGSLSVQAVQPEADVPAAQPVLGEATRLWLDRQSEGSQASAIAQPLSGPAMEQVYERYIKSFSHPIPEHFESERIGSGGSGR